MKVLAERSNKIFIWGPIAIAVSVLYFYLRFVHDITLTPRYYFFWFFLSLFFSALYNLIHRLMLPRILIEYDRAGIYVYTKRRGDPIIIRFEHLWSSIAMGGTDVYDEIGSTPTPAHMLDNLELTTGTCSCNSVTGTLRLAAQDQTITIHGVKNVGEVKGTLDRLIREHQKERMELYEERRQRRRREVELEELRKHDPNT